MFQNSFFTVLIILAACAQKNMNSSDMSFDQGIKGRIIWEEGNMMPGFDIDGQSAPKEVQGVKRTLFAFEAVKSSELEKTDDGFYEKPSVALIAQTESDKDGYFTLELPAGKYSLFVLEEGKYYANLMDGNNYVFPVDVKENEFQSVDFVINYKAVY